MSSQGTLQGILTTLVECHGFTSLLWLFVRFSTKPEPIKVSYAGVIFYYYTQLFMCSGRIQDLTFQFFAVLFMLFQYCKPA
jgi:hypothetical protein